MNRFAKIKFINLGIAILLIFIFSGLAGCGIGDVLNGNESKNDTVWLDSANKNGPSVVINTSGGTAVFNVEIADTTEERTKGLMFRESLPEKGGMLFIFDDDNIRNFWMKNTLIPLDMVFFDGGRKIVHIQKNAQPCLDDPCPTFSSKSPAKYVLEISGGASDKYKIQTGDTAEFNL